jgi:hypothetical protein
MDLFGNQFVDYCEAQEKENLKKRLEDNPEEEFIFEKYYDSLCSTHEKIFKSNYDFYNFLDEEVYEEARIKAKSCLKRGMDVQKIAEEDVEVWFEHVTACITILLMKFLSMKDLKNGQKIDFGTSEARNIYNSLQFEVKGEWEIIGRKLNEVVYTRNDFKHQYVVTNDHKKILKFRRKFSGLVLRERARERKDVFVEVHVESLKNIRKDFPNYEREKEV